jgi:hypothetical protein
MEEKGSRKGERGRNFISTEGSEPNRSIIGGGIASGEDRKPNRRREERDR